MAAITAADVTVVVTDRKIIGGQKRTFGTITFGSGSLTYTAGGVPLPAISAFGMARNLDSLHFLGVNGLVSDYTLSYDKANHKLQLFFQPGSASNQPHPETIGGFVLTARTYTFEAAGW